MNDMKTEPDNSTQEARSSAAHGSETGSTLTNAEHAECWLFAAVNANRNQDPIAAAKLAAGAISYLLLKERSPNVVFSDGRDDAPTKPETL